MSLLRSIEKKIEDLVEGTFGRTFRSNVQPVEIARRLAREMDGHQSTSLRQTYVPNVYDVYLSRQDFDRFAELEAALRNELSEYLAEHARKQNYSTFSRPAIALHVDEDLELGSFGIAVSMRQEQAAESAAPQTSVMPAVQAPTPKAPQLALIGSKSRYPLANERMTIGRGSRNDIVLNDPSVSREHAEIVPTPDGMAIRDRGSTNGVVVNGRPTSDHLLTAGDLVVLGQIELRCAAVTGESS